MFVNFYYFFIMVCHFVIIFIIFNIIKTKIFVDCFLM